MALPTTHWRFALLRNWQHFIRTLRMSNNFFHSWLYPHFFLFPFSLLCYPTPSLYLFFVFLSCFPFLVSPLFLSILILSYLHIFIFPLLAQVHLKFLNPAVSFPFGYFGWAFRREKLGCLFGIFVHYFLSVFTLFFDLFVVGVYDLVFFFSLCL